VDDHPANLRLLKHLIEEMGYQCNTVVNGADAVEATKHTSFDLILMDMKMPIMDGFTATKMIRGFENHNQKTPIVILSAHAMADEQQNLIHAGANDYAMKPITKQQLEVLIKQWVKHAHPRQDRPKPQQKTLNQSPFPDAAHVCTTQWINWEHALQLANFDETLAQDMLTMFVDSLKIDSANMQSYWAKRDYTQLLDVVHRIHGASRYCGVPAISDQLKHIESLLKRHEYDPLPPLCEALFTAFIELKQEAANRFPQTDEYPLIEETIS